MTLEIYLPLALAAAVALSTRWITSRGTPGTAARVLTAAAVVAAAASTWSLLLLALTMLDDVPPLSALDNHPRIELPEPVPGVIALFAGLGLLGAVIRLFRDQRHRGRLINKLRRAGEPHDGMVIADWSKPIAVAIPGRPGHLLVTSGMLRLLDADERRVLFAHEQAHLQHHHYTLASAAAAAAALNPILIPVRNAVAYLLERQADEEAAVVVGDRDLTAHAVARAALAMATGPAALSISGSAAVRRVRELRKPAPAPQHQRLLGPVVVSAGILVASAAATLEFIELARAWL
ncbi:M56 family metallopeptidase [Krasilnikovia sp. MM14-A1259]|uniref:M56 family metallopeptidase n=1 Tax=Krasilnikovia sp. MM14-A1259 TaxID=3373539 RepID=UPI0037F2CDDC